MGYIENNHMKMLLMIIVCILQQKNQPRLGLNHQPFGEQPNVLTDCATETSTKEICPTFIKFIV